MAQEASLNQLPAVKFPRKTLDCDPENEVSAPASSPACKIGQARQWSSWTQTEGSMLDEFRKAISQDFDAADRNDDGVLDAEEIDIFLRSR
jgi:hypothetical protein